MATPRFNGVLLSPIEVKLLRLVYEDPTRSEEDLLRELNTNTRLVTAKKDLKQHFRHLARIAGEPSIVQAAQRAKRDNIF
jgi:hypothetical protein